MDDQTILLDMDRRAKITALVQKEAGDDIELHFFPASRLHSPERASFAAYVIEQGIEVNLSQAA